MTSGSPSDKPALDRKTHDFTSPSALGSCNLGRHPPYSIRFTVKTHRGSNLLSLRWPALCTLAPQYLRGIWTGILITCADLRLSQFRTAVERLVPSTSATLRRGQGLGYFYSVSRIERTGIHTTAKSLSHCMRIILLVITIT
jgi:hypothetical protein